ncbi:hypothetical protein RHGRI_006407 [Rhododendron griersonianum]|uniref:Uncharacterized protein n=1 Tax=Rhododendron griersonianum TaxID=479676 RepID=A0AAV6KTE0_9ERIC|nr:hypothetical protein RHGRI_006407 [Rhododendron griersonianum]
MMACWRPFHNRSLYVEAEMNGVAVKRVMVDPDSAVNLIPMSTVEALGIPKENIGGAPIEEDAEKSSERVENLMKRDEAEPSERDQKKLKTDGEEQCIKVTLTDGKNNLLPLNIQLVLGNSTQLIL